MLTPPPLAIPSPAAPPPLVVPHEPEAHPRAADPDPSPAAHPHTGDAHTAPPSAAAPPTSAPAPPTYAPAPPELKPPDRYCLNCDTVVVDAFCAHCGQEYAGSNELSTRLTFHDLIDDAIQVNSTFFKTLWVLVVKPGELTDAYLTGRRARYVSPSKLYLVVSFVFFLIAQQVDPITMDMVTDYMGKDYVVAAATEHGMSQLAFGQSIENRVADAFPTWLFVLVPGLAIGMKLLYWRRNRTFAAHTVFAFHYLSFMMISAIPCSFVPESISDEVTWVWMLGILPLWAMFAIRRVYGQSWVKTILKAFLAWLLLFTLFMLYYTGIAFWAVEA